MGKQTGENALARILNASPAQLEYVLKHKARAQEVLDAWLADSDELAHETDDEWALRVNAVIAKNLDVDSIHHFIKIIGSSTGRAVRTELADKASARARAAANALHNKPGNSREKQEAIRAAWASGKFANRDLCAEQECAALNMAVGTARRALRNTPKPPRRCTA